MTTFSKWTISDFTKVEEAKIDFLNRTEQLENDRKSKSPSTLLDTALSSNVCYKYFKNENCKTS